MSPRIKITKELLLDVAKSFLFDEVRLGCRSSQQQHLIDACNQIIEDCEVMDEFEQGWRDIGKYMRDHKILRGKLMGENLLLHDQIEKIKVAYQTKNEDDFADFVRDKLMETSIWTDQ